MHTLKYPATIDGATVSAVPLRRPTGADMIAIGDHLPALMSLGRGEEVAVNAAVFTALVAVAGRLTDLGDKAGQLDWADLQDVVSKAMAALGEAPGSAGGGTSGAA